MKDFARTRWEWREVHSGSVATQHSRAAFLHLLVPFLAAGVLWLVGKTLFAAIVATGGLVLLVLRLTARSLHDVVLTLLASLARRLGVGISYAGLTATYFLVFAPIAFIGRLLRRDTLEVRWRPEVGTYWVELPHLDPIRLIDKPFLTETRRTATQPGSVKILRLARAGYHTAITLFLVNLALGYLAARVLDYQADRLDDRSHIEVYERNSWAADYFKEFSQSFVNTYRPFIHWVRRDYAGHFVNIKDGHRQTYRTAIASETPVRLYAFGASAMWGTGSRDDYTIPSYLVKLAEQEGVPLAAENFAQSGFVNWQSVIALAEACADGKVPDLVVFYEGAGDVSAKLQATSLKRVHANFFLWQDWIERHDDPLRWLKRNSLIHILAREVGYRYQARQARRTVLSAEPERVQRLAHDVVSLYEDQSAFVKHLADVYGFKVWFFWQPVVYTKKQPTALEQTYPFGANVVYTQLMADVYRAASQQIRSREFAIDLSTSFDDQDRTIFIDWAHYSDVGNEIIAAKMYGALRPALQALVQSRAENGAAR